MRQNFTELNRVSNTTKIEMVVEMKPADKEDNAEAGRSLRSRRVNYTINENNSNKEENKIIERGTIIDKDEERG